MIRLETSLAVTSGRPATDASPALTVGAAATVHLVGPRIACVVRDVAASGYRATLADERGNTYPIVRSREGVYRYLGRYPVTLA
jgi:hypothetical protein